MYVSGILPNPNRNAVVTCFVRATPVILSSLTCYQAELKQLYVSPGNTNPMTESLNNQACFNSFMQTIL